MAELFDRFEVDRVPRWPLLSRLVALSIVLHGVFFVTVAYVPTMRNLLYVAGAMSGLKFVSEDYDPTLIGQRATIVKLEPYEKLYYPPDYFGAPEVAEVGALDPMMIQPAAPPPPPPPAYRPPRMRRPKAAAPEPSPSPEVAEAAPSPSPEATPPPEAEQKQAEAEIDRIAREKGIKRPVINQKPFEDFALKGKEMVDQGKLNLNGAVDVKATGERNADGTLNPETVKIEWRTASDENMALLAQQLITALSQSRVLSALEGARGVQMELKLDQQNVSIKIMSDLPSEDEARKFAEGYASMVLLGRLAKRGTDEGELYNNLKFRNEGAQFTMSFEMPKESAGRMISKMLAKKAADAAAAAQTKS